MDTERKSEAYRLQKQIFTIGEEYMGEIEEIDEAVIFVKLNCGAKGQILVKNLPKEEYHLSCCLTFKIIGFTATNYLELIPVTDLVKHYSTVTATVEIVSNKGIVAFIEELKQTAVYIPNNSLNTIFAQLKPQQNIRCIAYQTQNGVYIDEITSVFHGEVEIKNFCEEIFNEGRKKGSLVEKDGIKLGQIYIATNYPTKTHINGYPVSVDSVDHDYEDKRELEVIVTFIPKMDWRSIRVKLISVLN